MHYSPINPSDVFYVKGLYGLRKPLPTIGGFEGCGIIEAAKESQLIGKKIMCWADDSMNNGTWADYFLANSKNTIMLDDNISLNNQDFAKYCSPYINPMTAIGFLEIA